MRKKTIALAALAVAGTLTLAACGGNDSMGNMPGMGSSSTSSSPTSSSDAMSDFNDADVTFATEMIPHHRQAVAMAKLADTRAESQQVKDLAMQIMNAQDPEIQTMSGWLTAWGKPVPSDDTSMGGMDMGGDSSMAGMMSGADMDKLKKASGADFDQMFLTMMIAHHQGAIEMAKTEETNGMNADAIALAQQIQTAQASEITTMNGLLK
ncbi:DUF305 domain-containing protein [Nocardioides fonticola]|uniref:DUF305 domain-containing protein n=1 Tax=Nocardioides fonticola TaxID=450363 RepID=A0ABP7XXP5_9ACTN